MTINTAKSHDNNECSRKGRGRHVKLFSRTCLCVSARRPQRVLLRRGFGQPTGVLTRRGGIYKEREPHRDQSGELLRLCPQPTGDLSRQGPEGLGPGGAARPPPAAAVTVKRGSAAADGGQGPASPGRGGSTTSGGAGRAESLPTAGLGQAIRPRRICFGFPHGDSVPMRDEKCDSILARGPGTGRPPDAAADEAAGNAATLSSRERGALRPSFLHVGPLSREPS